MTSLPRRALVKGAVILMSCAVALILAEALLRISGVWIGRHSDTMFTVMDYDPLLGWKMKPNVEERVSFVDVENVPVRANSLGFRDKEFKSAKDPNKVRIAFLGDSITWGLGVNESDRFTDVIAANDQHFETLNFGMPGFGNDQELLVWRNIASRYQPDIVVLTIYTNDYADNMFVVRSGLRKPYFERQANSTLQLRDLAGDQSNFWSNGIFNEAAPPYTALFAQPVEKRSRILHWLVKHSDLARLGYTILRHSNEADQPVVTTASAQGEKQTSAKSAADLSSTELAESELMDAIVKQLASEVASARARFLVVLAGESNKNFDVQKAALQREQIDYVDATTQPLEQRLSGAAYFPYNKHWTPSAHRAVAELIVQALKKQGSYEKQ